MSRRVVVVQPVHDRHHRTAASSFARRHVAM
jgi:hypothetical protein